LLKALGVKKLDAPIIPSEDLACDLKRPFWTSREKIKRKQDERKLQQSLW